GLHKLSPADDSIAAVGSEPSRNFDTGLLKIAGIATDANGRVWMAAWDRGLLLYDPANGSWRQWLADEDGVTGPKYGRISAIHRRGSTIWVGSDIGGIVCFDVRTLGPSCEIPFAAGYQEQVRSIYLDASAHLWVATLGGGLTRIDTASGERAVYQYRPASTTSINSNDVVTLFEDRSGVLWLGTLGAGASHFEINGQGIAHFESDPLADSTLRSNAVRALAESADGRIWIGTDGGGLHYFDPQTEQLAPFDVAGSYYDERIWSLQATPGGMLWIGTWGGGAYLLDPQKNRVQKHLSRADGLADDVVTLLKLDSQQRLWIGSEGGGINRFDSHSGQLSSFRNNPSDTFSIASDFATSFYEDRAGNVWVGLYGAGINRYLGEQRFERLPAGAAAAPGLEIEDVTSIAERADGRFWLGTGNGLGLFDPDSRKFDKLLAIESPSGSRVIDLVFDSAGDLWMSSDSGLYRYTKSSGLTEHLTRQDGLQSLSFSHGAALAASDGTLYFGGPNGFNRFDPAGITSNEFAPAIVITDIRVLQEAVANPIDASSGRRTTPFQLQSLQLKHDQNHISFEFAALHYVSPADNQYAYQLAGFDTDWNYTPATNRIANYTNLPPGDYELRIKAANSDGVWTNSERRLALTILPPWWMTGWAFAAYAIGFALLVTTLIGIRTHRLKVHSEQLRAEVRRKTQTVVEQNRTIEAQATDLRQALESRNDFFA
ncbi:MAG: two-component regulator propeller domain-containing protein, partial [Woeseia sp.]